MNSHHQPIQQAPPAVPIHNERDRRRAHVPYTPSPPFHHVPPYQGYAYQYPMQYPRPPQQWTPYPIPMQMGRGYQQYPHMNPYQMPPNYPPMRPHMHHTPSSSSIPSSRPVLSPSPSNHTFNAPQPAPALSPSPNIAASITPPPQAQTTPAPPRSPSPPPKPFYPPLPWQSFEGDFPTKKVRRRRKPAPQSSNMPVELPRRDSGAIEESTSSVDMPANVDESAAGLSRSDASFASLALSEALSTQPTTPSSTTNPKQTTPKAEVSTRAAGGTLPVIPAVPNIPALARPMKQSSSSTLPESMKNSPNVHDDSSSKEAEGFSGTATEAAVANTEGARAAPQSKPVPKSWADLVRTKTSTQPRAQVGGPNLTQTNGVTSNQGSSLAEALGSYSVKDSSEINKTSFLEPRGLVNTGNMCYMNSILQVLVFCVPFHNFLENIGRRAAHSFKSDTPMMDAMIMFVREFKIIDAAASVEQLRMRLKENELEQYGESFTPEFVYDVIRRLPRFSSMRRGHQQDAEEFLGFLLEELHDECSRSMKQLNGGETASEGKTSPISERTDDNGWLEVGPKQRAAITRSSGSLSADSPITKIFGGKLRSELRIPGMKSSVTLEPYQPLQLDIGAAHVSNIVDALKGLTRSETLHGDFNSPRGPGSTATKQVTIETLPQVLILHLKRFQYDNTGGTQKIWKKVGYPLELEIPKEVFPQSKRAGLLAHGGLPKYRLISVVYHHGKNASGGHYTVDVRRQEGREWIRLDDTVIKRIRSEDVAEGGSEEDPKVLAAALEKHKRAQSSGAAKAGSNVYNQIADDEEEDNTGPAKAWSQVNGSTPAATTASNKKWSGVIANGVSTPNAKTSGDLTPVGRSSIKDNKVAYILFYQRIER